VITATSIGPPTVSEGLVSFSFNDCKLMRVSVRIPTKADSYSD